MLITISNSFTIITNYTTVERATVAATLRYIDENIERERQHIEMSIAKAMRFGYRRKIGFLAAKLDELGSSEVCLLGDDDTFPTGLLAVVLQDLNKKAINYELNDIRERPEPYNIYRWKNEPPPLRYYQEDCIKIGREKGRGTYACAVGSGKTIIATHLIKEAGVNCLFIVPSIALSEQTKQTFDLYFGKENVQQLTTATVKSKKKLKPIRISTIQTLASLQKRDMLSIIINDIDMLVIDEAHHSAANSFLNLLPELNHIYYRYNFTGTYKRNDSKIMELWGVCGEQLYKYNAADAIKDGFLTPLKFKIRTLNGRSGENFHSEYTENYGSREFLDALIQDVRAIPMDKSILILVDRKEAVGHQIHDWLNAHNITNTYVNGDDDKGLINVAIKGFNAKEIRILVASQILGEGVDIRSTDVLIMARGGKSDIAGTQAVGRAVRLFPGKKEALVIDYDFRYSNWMSNHTKKRIENYAEEFAGEINWA